MWNQPEGKKIHKTNEPGKQQQNQQNQKQQQRPDLKMKRRGESIKQSKTAVLQIKLVVFVSMQKVAFRKAK